MALMLFSPVFENGGYIPTKYSCRGQDVSPPLLWHGVSEKAMSLVLIVDDPDAPRGVFTHWIVFNIPPSIPGLDENVPRSAQLPDGSRQGKNSAMSIGYMGPCPPPGKVHHYHFRLYVLDCLLGLKGGIFREQVLDAIAGHVQDTAEIVGLFEIKNQDF